MPLFIWHKKYSVGNEELDSHHKNLFDIFNRLYDNCLEPDSAGCSGTIIDELISYSEYHFLAEEEQMRKTGYAERGRHMQMHRNFSERALRLRKLDDASDQEVAKELIVYLGNWLLHHVMEEDRKIIHRHQ